MRSKIGTICMVLGTVMVIAALSLFGWNAWENKRAGDSVDKIMPELAEEIQNGSEQAEQGEENKGKIEIEGNVYIGYLTIPELGLELPVMDSWNKRKSQIAPCRYYGAADTENLVIAGHNYRRHFAELKKLHEGDEVYFTDVNGKGWKYQVTAIDILPENAVEEMTSGKSALTLFTCTYDGKSRITVRCSLTK